MERQRLDEVLAEDVACALGVGPLDLDLGVESARPQDGGIDHVLAVGGSDDDDVVESLDAVDLREQLRDDVGLDVARDARAPRAEQRVHLSKKTTTGVPSEAFSRARWKMSRMWRSVSPTYLLSSSGP